jgi:AAA domain
MADSCENGTRGPERPLLILVNGAPGSGKSMLSQRLGDRLRLPVISKDRLRQSTLWSLGSPHMADAPWGPGLWYGALEHLLSGGMSAIGDMALFRGMSEPDVAARLAPLARLLHIHCRCRDPLSRFEARTRADPLRSGDLDGLLAEVIPLCADLQEPLQLGCRCIVVDTDDGYVPSLDELVATVVRQYGPHLTSVLAERSRAPKSAPRSRSVTHDGNAGA